MGDSKKAAPIAKIKGRGIAIRKPLRDVAPLRDIARLRRLSMIAEGARDIGPTRSVAAAVRAALGYRRTGAVVASTALLMMGPRPTLAQEGPSDAAALTEITVTAQRRKQTVQDIPYNISVVSGADVASSGATTLTDLTRTVNGLITVDQGPAARANANNLTLRGLRTDSPGGGQVDAYLPVNTVNPVSTYFGETPIFFPMALQDVDRVEVLRGPQGTLYGSGAEAGTIRFIPHEPDFTATSGEVSATGSYTEHAVQPNGSIHAVLNLPLADNFAARLVVGQDRLAGFINAVNIWELEPNGTPKPSIPGNLSSGPVIGPEQKGVNSSNQTYARLALRWQPSSVVDLHFDFLHQRTTMADSQEVSPFWPGGCVNFGGGTPVGVQIPCQGAPVSAFHTNPGGKYTTASFAIQPYSNKVDLGSVVANIDLGFAKLTSATSYDVNDSYTLGDGTYQGINLGGPDFNSYPPYNNYPRILNFAPVPAAEHSFVQELRLVSSGQNRFDYVVGGFFQRDTASAMYTALYDGLQAFDSQIGQPEIPPPPLGDIDILSIRNTEFTDRALFGELTAHIMHAWQVTGGLRFYDQDFSQTFFEDLPICGAVCSTDQTNPLGLDTGQSNQSFRGHLKKFNTSYDFGPTTKVYATYSEGFRRGGTNALGLEGPFASLPQYQTYQPDFAKNYEVGVKGTLFEKRVSYSAAVYRVDLKDFQFNAYSLSGYSATFNGSTARSKGVELELHAALTRDLTVFAGYTYTDAKTTASVTKDDLVPFALLPAYGGTGITDTAVAFTIPSGARLPGVPQNTATFGIDYTIPSSMLPRQDLSLLLHADGAYRSSANGNIDATSIFFWEIPSSFITNARATLGVGERTSVDLFVNNITSDTAYSGAAYPQTIVSPDEFRTVSRPRTVGLTLHYKF
jgi:iron complex outermembrane receptor protein